MDRRYKQEHVQERLITRNKRDLYSGIGELPIQGHDLNIHGQENLKYMDRRYKQEHESLIFRDRRA
jgi:hypothetical protein